MLKIRNKNDTSGRFNSLVDVFMFSELILNHNNGAVPLGWGVAPIEAPKQGRSGSVTQPLRTHADRRRDGPAECLRFARWVRSLRNWLRTDGDDDEEEEEERVKAGWS